MTQELTSDSTFVAEKCIFCPDSEVRPLIPRNILVSHVAVLKCRKCGLVFLESRADAGEEDPEERTYWQNDQKEIYMQDEIQKVFKDEFTSRLATLSRYKAGGHLLDVGCGVGHFLDTAREKNWEVSGLDISPVASEAAKEKYGVNVIVGTLDAADIPDESYDVVSLWDVIEHIRKPIENMKAANRIMKTGGVLVMKTPNEDSLYKLIARLAFRLLGRYGSFLVKYVYYVPHYFSYSKKTMNILLEQSGFEVLSYELDETPQEFGVEKINAHYKKDSKRKYVIALLPIINFLSRLFGRQNKITVYARKVRSIS